MLLKTSLIVDTILLFHQLTATCVPLDSIIATIHATANRDYFLNIEIQQC